MKGIIQQLKYKGTIGFYCYLWLYKLYFFLTNYRFSDRAYIQKIFKRAHDYPLNLENPKTLNEKIQWLKLHDRKPIYSTFADKFAVRDYIAKELGPELLIPLVFYTQDYKDIRIENFPDFPVIVKGSHDSGSYIIVKDKHQVNWHELQTNCREWLHQNYYWADREHPYKNIPPGIVVEKLLLTSEGKIPNDYKLNVFNGKVEFIYTSVDREGKNKRNIYTANWEPLYFHWNKRHKIKADLRGEEIPPPTTLDKMIEFSEKIGRQFAYVRMDFYDVDGKLYFGEITQFHGGGFDMIEPVEYDYFYGNLIDLSKINPT